MNAFVIVMDMQVKIDIAMGFLKSLIETLAKTFYIVF
jgi:hypothetical protein